MSALAQERDTQERNGLDFDFPMSANVKAFQGGIAVMTHTGTVQPATAAPNLAGVGCFTETVDNTGGAAGAQSVRIKRGCFHFANLGDVTLGDVGQAAYAVDDQTVSASSNGNTCSQVGTIQDVDATGVWVKF